jgi:hypothetical protein
MAEIKENFGFGGANLTPGGGAGTPTLAEALRDVADDLAGVGNDWQSGLAVTTHVLVMAQAGAVLAVEGTTGSGTGVKQMQFSASPAAGFVRVEYDAAGVPTLTFNATDAITEAAVMQAAGPNVKTTKG